MGNAQSSNAQDVAAAKACFSPAEISQLKAYFVQASGAKDENSAVLDKEKFAKIPSNQAIPCQLVDSIWKLLSSTSLFALSDAVGSLTLSSGATHAKPSSINFSHFIVAMSHLLKGDYDAHARVLIGLANDGDASAKQMTDAQFLRVLQLLFPVYASLESQTIEFRTWRFDSQQGNSESSKTLFAYLLKNLKSVARHGLYLHFFDICAAIVHCLKKKIHAEDIVRWFNQNLILLTVMDAIIQTMFGFNLLIESADPKMAAQTSFRTATIPTALKPATTSKAFKSLLNLSSLLALNQHVPVSQRRVWRLLYSSQIHGESFSTMLNNITNKGPTLLIIRDKTGHLFGGFCSDSWALRPTFFGNENCFLFTLSPDMNLYFPTGYNKNYAYLNIHQETLPNGLGMGGQIQASGERVHYFSLFVDVEFVWGKSHSNCMTYNSPQLSGSERFDIDLVEVWAVGEEKINTDNDEVENEPSILDKDPELKAILAMTGRKMHSEGLRETPTDDKPEEGELYHVRHANLN